jgi:hypothetical protein
VTAWDGLHPPPVVAKRITQPVHDTAGREIIAPGLLLGAGVDIPEELGGANIWQWCLVAPDAVLIGGLAQLAAV